MVPPGASTVESGVLAWLRGEFDAARSLLEPATADLAAADRDQIDAVWFVPSDADRDWRTFTWP